MDIQINERLIKYNFSSRKGEKIKYIVIHDTANYKVGADSEAHFNFFNTSGVNVSAHYLVDDKQILRVVKESDKSWHCGDGKGKYEITNENSIGIEICVNKDGDFEKAFKKSVELASFLLHKYDLNVGSLVRHYDASKKICPNIMSRDNWSKWKEFKELVNENMNRDYKEFINKIYNNVLGREVDNDGLNYWNDKLKNEITVSEFMKSLSESDEFKDKYFI